MFQHTPIGQEHCDSTPYSAWQRWGHAPDEETEVQILHGHVTETRAQDKLSMGKRFLVSYGSSNKDSGFSMKMRLNTGAKTEQVDATMDKTCLIKDVNIFSIQRRDDEHRETSSASQLCDHKSWIISAFLIVSF